MPRIDPERLLKTLAPLLDPNTGGIKSDREVDKIYGLMSKFSRKLVSKVIYISILKASNHEVLDLYLQRGGWDMILGWTVDAFNKKNYTLLKEIGELLLNAPTSIQRLKENELPKVIKTLSKDCENEEIRELAKQVVTKWIAIAKQQDNPAQISNTMQVNNKTRAQDSSTPGVSINSSGVVKLENNVVGESETVPAEFEFDINEMMDFNPEVFKKVVDQHLGDITADSGNHSNNEQHICNTEQNVGMEISSSNQIKAEASAQNAVDSNMPKAPKLLIKTIGGQRAVVQSVGLNETAKQEDAPFCIMMKDGKPFLVRLKIASPSEVTRLGLQATSEQEANAKESHVLPVEKKRRPRKDPTITSMRNLNIPQEERHRPNILKTYSKKNPEEPQIENSATQVVAETLSPTAKNKLSEKELKDKSEDRKSSNAVKKHRSGSKSGSAAAAAAAKKQADEEKLREKIKKEKGMLKKRAKEVAKQKQQEKDQETLKKLNLSSTPTTKPSNSSPSSMKMPKIPKKQSSFADAIGIPGASESAISIADKVVKENKKSSGKSSSMDTSETSDAPGLPATKFYGKKEETVKVENSQERRHRVKVFTSKKSRNDDLLKDMTENAKSNKSNKAESLGKGNDSPSTSLGEKSITSVIKPEKRPSVDGIEKPGDIKKQKLSLSDEKDKKDAKEKEAKSVKEKSKTTVIKESSLFMDALAASTEAKPVSKRKRRLSSSNEKEVAVVNNIKSGKNSTINNSKDKPPSPTTDEASPSESVKPIFNFYRDTLGDDESPPYESSKVEKSTTEEDNQMEMETSEGQEAMDGNAIDVFTPTEDELRLKSALVIHRSRNKQKKSVRFREEEELREIFTFELDETERVNVTKQKSDFTSMKQHEKAEEKEFLAKNLMRRILGPEETEEKMPWRKLIPLILEAESSPILSEEKAIQEERERITLGVFLPPGSVLPDSPSEPDPVSPDADDHFESRVIPSDDVNGVTKLFDRRNDVWPRPKPDGHGMMAPNRPQRSSRPYGLSQGIEQPNFSSSNFEIPHNNQASALPPGFPPPVQNAGIDFNNPWNINGVSMPLPPNATNIGEIPGFTQISPNMMGPAGALGFQNMSNPFGIPIQNPPPGFIPPNMNFPPPSQTQMMQNNINREMNQGGIHNSSRGRGGAGGTGRDFGDRDQRRPFKDSRDSRDSRTRDYDNRTRSRDYRSRDHDRDRRSPSPSRRRRDDRERDRHSREDKDYRDHDYRSRTNSRSGKKDIPCRFFRKGHCNSGSRCEFSHGELGPDQNHEKSRSDNTRGIGRHSSPSLISGNEEGSSHSSSSASNSITSQFERRPSKDEATSFTDAPSSPTDEIAEDPSLLLTTVTEPAKIIPVE